MRGRIVGVKKTKILKFVLITHLLLFLTAILINILIIPNYPAFWFFAFSFFVGTYEVLKSRLFKLDSGFYLGSLLTLIGISGFIFLFTNTTEYVCEYLLTDFILASFLTYLVCGQKFHLVIMYSLFFALVFTLLFTFSYISLPIFIAILVSYLLLLIVIIIVNVFGRK